MKIVNSLLYFFIFILSLNLSTAQEKKMLSQAHARFDKFAFVDAREIYLDLARKGHRPADLLMKLGDSYYFNGELKKAFEWYAELVTKFSEYDSEYLFRYAQTLKSMELYDEAHTRMKEYYHKKGVNYTDAYSYRERDYLKLINLQSGKADVAPFELNSIYAESGPMFLKDGNILFASARDTDDTEVDSRNNQPFADLYRTKGTMVSKFDVSVNSKLSETSAALTKNGDTLYFTRRTDFTGKKLKKYGKAYHTKLYRAVLHNGKWKSIVQLPFNSKKYSVGYPALSPDGKKLYFSSDMPGGFGKMDIYEVDLLKRGRFGEPKNLGNTVNTIGNEISPFVGARNSLYFASNGQLGLGGLDIFVSEFPNGEFLDPINLGRPINSATDDFGLIINSGTNEGYFVSNRPESLGATDIYKFTLKENFITHCQQKLQLQLRDKDSKNALAGIETYLLDENYNQIDKGFTDANGFYEFVAQCSRSYIIRTKNSAHKTQEVAYQTNYMVDKVNSLTIDLARGQDLTKTTIALGDDLNDVLQLSTIFFDKNKAELREEDKVELLKVVALLKENLDLRIEVKAHTDNKGDRGYNQKLSLQRSLSVKNYLVYEGNIDASRVKAIGMGEIDPKIDCKDDCTERENQINRRSEFVVVR